MNFLLCFAIFVGLIAIWAPFNTSGARVCVIDLRNCRSNSTTANTAVCGRFGRSNLCQRFSNLCALQSANCATTTPYTQVNRTFCTGISLNQRGICNGLSSTSTGTGLLSNLFGLGSATTSNVQPIIIRT